MEKARRILSVLALMMIAAVVSFLATRWHYKCTQPGTLFGHQWQTTYDTVTYVDTVKYIKPIAQVVKPNGYGEVNLSVEYLQSVLDSLPDIRADTTMALCPIGVDSVGIEIPLTQSMFSDSTYTAWVTGANVTMDSIFVYPTREVITIKHPPKHWHIGISGGYGATTRGLSPYIGIGVTYSILSF